MEAGRLDATGWAAIHQGTSTRSVVVAPACEGWTVAVNAIKDTQATGLDDHAMRLGRWIAYLVIHVGDPGVHQKMHKSKVCFETCGREEP